MKVRIKEGKISLLNYEGKNYYPGDVLDIPEDKFIDAYMEDLTPKPAVKAEVEEEKPLPSVEKEDKPSSRRKATSSS